MDDRKIILLTSPQGHPNKKNMSKSGNPITQKKQFE
jgi:hypothetical protein